MAGQTPRFSLNFFGGDTPGSLDDDNDKYTSEDRLMIDRIMAALEKHNHRVTASLDVPDDEPDLTLGSLGTLESGSTFYYVVSFVNADGLETISGPETSIELPDQLGVPDAPSGVSSNGAGTLTSGLYYYALSAIRGDEETPLSEVFSLTVLQGEDTVTLTLPSLGDATSFQIWRQKDTDPQWTRVATTAASSYTDLGAVPASAYGDPDNIPPSVNSGVGTYSVTIALTGDDLTRVTTATSWRIYRSETSGAYSAASLVHEVVETQDELDPDSGLVTSWIDDGDAPLTGSPKLFSTELNVPPFTFETAATTLPPAANYPVGYPIVLNSTGVLYIQKAGTWTAISGGSGGGGGGGAAITQYDSGATYNPGDVVYDLLGQYINQVTSTGVDPSSYDPLTTLGGYTVTPTPSSPAGVNRVAFRFQLSANIDSPTGFTIKMDGDVAIFGGTFKAAIQTDDPTVSYNPIATLFNLGGTGVHDEQLFFISGPVPLVAATSYYLVLSGDLANQIHLVDGGSLTAVVSAVDSTTTNSTDTGLGVTTTADTRSPTFKIIKYITYWQTLGNTYGLNYHPGADLTWDSGFLYLVGAVVKYQNALWYGGTGNNVNNTPGVSPYWALLSYVVPAGGTTGQVLTKSSGTDGDYVWATP